MTIPVLQTGKAWQSMDELPHTQVTHTSSLYTSAPMGPQDQPGYVNSVVRLHTKLPALDLLDALQAIEKSAGSTTWQPTLDGQNPGSGICCYMINRY